MLVRMGDNRFLMGNVMKNSYKEIFGGDILKEITSKSCVEILPLCSSCVYQAYCGADPVRNYLETKDIIGRRPNDFCKKNYAIFDFIFEKLRKNSKNELDVFWSWLSNKYLNEIR